MITGTHIELHSLCRLIKTLSDQLEPEDEEKPNILKIPCYIKIEILKEAREFYIDNFTKKTTIMKGGDT